MKIRFLLFLFLVACGGGELGRSFKDSGSLRTDQEKKGYMLLAQFDESWPAEVTEVRTAMDTIQFTRENGVPHDYAGYTGYELKLIRLKGRGGAPGYVLFRSKEKKAK